MELTTQITVDASPEDAWRVIGSEFATVDTWAARMLSSEFDAAAGDLGARNVETVEYGPATETLYAYDSRAKRIGYTVEAPGMPPMISDVTTEWVVGDGPEGETTITLSFAGTMADDSMADMLEATWRKGAQPLMEELRHYVETGQPHPHNATVRE